LANWPVEFGKICSGKLWSLVIGNIIWYHQLYYISIIGNVTRYHGLCYSILQAILYLCCLACREIF